VELLVLRGADLSLKDNSGESSEDLLTENAKAAIKKLKV